MSICVVSYDLGGPETSASYKKLHEKLQSFPNWTKPLESYYIIKSSKSSSDIRDELKLLLDENDKLLVIRTPASAWASSNINKTSNDWLKTHGEA